MKVGTDSTCVELILELVLSEPPALVASVVVIDENDEPSARIIDRQHVASDAYAMVLAQRIAMERGIETIRVRDQRPSPSA